MNLTSLRQSVTGQLGLWWTQFRRSPLGHGQGAWLLSAILVFFGTVGAGFAWGSWRNLCADCPSIALIQAWEPQQTSKLYAIDGRLIAELGIERRTQVDIATLPPHVAHAVIAVEDRRFYNHGAFDTRALARAVFGKLTGRALGGGSTISQQLARNIFEGEVGFERVGLRGYFRKLRELQVAMQLEEVYTKDQILEAYMNEIYMGVGAQGGALYGFQAAARGYLGKDLSEVNVAEAALLAALLNRPGTYDPFNEPENALRRRNLVLALMRNQGYLTREEEATWREWPLPVREDVGREGGTQAPYFVEEVRRLLDQRFGPDLYTDGLQIYTTLDLDMQEAAERSMEEGFAALEARGGFNHPKYADFAGRDTTFASGQTPYLQGMMLAMDPGTGGIRAMIGGRDFGQSSFNRATQALRQAGSAFKPFVYTAAIANGIPASHVVVDAPVVLDQVDGTIWSPENYDGTFSGPIPIREGLIGSINTIAVKLGTEVGISTVTATARRMGIRTEIPPFPSSFIGAADVIPIQLLEAYSGFANVGEVVTPRLIERVTDANGNVLWEPRIERRRALEPDVARIAVDMLEDVVTRGTGARAIRINAALPAQVAAGGKTGTTNDGTNVWFMGFTPNLVAGVWFGMDRPQKLANDATGGSNAAPVWGRFMRRVYYGETDVEGAEGILPIPDPWPMPPTLIRREVDAQTGLLPSPFCPEDRRYVEIFLPGTVPTELCGASEGIGRFGGARRSRGGGGGGGG